MFNINVYILFLYDKQSNSAWTLIFQLLRFVFMLQPPSLVGSRYFIRDISEFIIAVNPVSKEESAVAQRLTCDLQYPRKEICLRFC